jgi:hypothetical protein
MLKPIAIRIRFLNVSTKIHIFLDKPRFFADGWILGCKAGWRPFPLVFLPLRHEEKEGKCKKKGTTENRRRKRARRVFYH